MGGHLSCVSCQNRKTADIKTTTTKKVIGVAPSSTATAAVAASARIDSSTAAPAAANFSSSSSSSTVKYCPVTSGWELYQILKSKEISFTRKENDEKLSQLEIVAMAIVEINLYLASQVIFPAIERYLREEEEGRIGNNKIQLMEVEEEIDS